MTTGVPGMTATDAANAFPTAAEGTVFLNGLNEIRAAGWRESATATDEWAESELIDSYHKNQNRCGDSPNPAEHGVHLGRSQLFFNRLASLISDSCTLRKSQIASLRGRTTRSKPLGS